MKNIFASRPIRNWLGVLLLTLVGAPIADTARAALYQPGDIVTNLTFYARRAFTRPDGTAVPAGAPVRIKDFPGHIVFLEWFAVWCPYCTAAVPQVETGIVDWYDSSGGNPYGVPVLYLFVNQEPASFYQSQTDNYINTHLDSSTIVLNDFSAVGGPNLVRPGFQSSGQPIFAVINGVTNSASHQPWQVLVNYLGYGQTEFNATLAGFRSIIDAVQPTIVAPRITNAQRLGADFEFTFPAQLGRAYRVQVTTNLLNWTTLITLNGSNSPVMFRHTNAPPSPQLYRVVTP